MNPVGHQKTLSPITWSIAGRVAHCALHCAVYLAGMLFASLFPASAEPAASLLNAALASCSPVLKGAAFVLAVLAGVRLSGGPEGTRSPAWMLKKPRTT